MAQHGGLWYLVGIKVWLHQDVSPSRGRPEQQQDAAQQRGPHPRLRPLAPATGPPAPCGQLYSPAGRGGRASKPPGQRTASRLRKSRPLCSLFGTIARVSPPAPGVISGRAPEGSHLAQALPTCGHRGGSPGPLGAPLGSTHGQLAPARRLPLGAQVPQSPHPLTSLHRSGVTISQAWGPCLRGTEVTSEARAALPPAPGWAPASPCGGRGWAATWGGLWGHSHLITGCISLRNGNVAGEAPQAGGGSGQRGLSPGGLFCPVRGRHLRSSTWPGALRIL